MTKQFLPHPWKIKGSVYLGNIGRITGRKELLSYCGTPVHNNVWRDVFYCVV